MKNYTHNHIITLLNKVSPRFTPELRGDLELYADCGLDSREFIHIIREIELELQHDIHDEDLLEAELITINDLIVFVNHLNQQKNNKNDK